MKTEAIRRADGRFIGERILEATFDEWLKYVFDHPNERYESHWVFEEEYPQWDVDAATTAHFITQTYSDPKIWMRKYTLKQLAQGLAFTWNPVYGDICYALTKETVSWDVRKPAIQSISTLYRDCFQVLCDPGLSNLDECSNNPLNGPCYMFWDAFPTHGRSKDSACRERHEECLRVMEQTLQIDHDACREAALHGLGHWQMDYPAQVVSIIDNWKKAVTQPIRNELLEYAEAAREGYVQ
jgi:hypothetical protein